MLNRIAILALGAAALGAAALPHAAAAADYHDDGAGRSPAFRGEDGFRGEGEGFAPREDVRPAHRFHGPRRDPGPVVFDERDPDRHHRGPAFGNGFEGGPAYGIRRPDFAYGRPAGFGPRFERPYGPVESPDGFGDGVPFRGRIAYDEVTGPAGSAYGPHPGAPDVGCTVEEARSVTPAGWRKIVTHRTCYRR